MYTITFEAAPLIKGLHLEFELAAAKAVESTATRAAEAWQRSVLTVPGIWQPIRDRYAASIKVDYSPNGMWATVYSDDPMATPIETGIPERDLKTMLNTSLKARVVTQGKYKGMRYLIIPFRHNTPGNEAHGQAMPQSVYNAVKDRDSFASSAVKRLSFRKNEIGAHGFTGARAGQLLAVRSRQYQWGDRLKTGGMGLSKADARRYSGMVAFKTNSGGQQSSDYMTFRIMGEWSKGWKVPAQPGRYIVKSVSEAAREMLKDEMAKAIDSVGGS